MTGLFGAAGAGKSTALRLLLGIEAGRGVTLVDGRPLHELAHPAREIGALLGDVPGHPGRTARGHLRMLCAAFGVPMSRADEVLEAVGLDAVAGERLEAFSLGMDRRLGFATALLTRPRALVLDDPVRGLPPREAALTHEIVRRHAAEGGAVLLAGRDAGALARTADRVIALDEGRVVADEPAESFVRTRLRPYVAVRSPYARKLADLLGEEGAEVVEASGNRIAVYGSNAAVVGETAYRHGILLHQLADSTADGVPEPRSEEKQERKERGRGARPWGIRRPRGIAHRPGPVRPLRYEVRRAFGVRTPWPAAIAALLCSVLATALVTRLDQGSTSAMRLMSGWLPQLPLPAVALGAGVLGALSYGQEFRYPALAPGHGPEARSPRLLSAKLAVGAGTALLLAAAAAVADLVVLHLIAPQRAEGALAHPEALATWAALAVACSWAGVLAAAVFRTTALGVSAVLAVPLLVVPGLRALLGGEGTRELSDAGGALWSVASGVSQDDGGPVSRALRAVGQPLFLALALSLTALVAAFAASTLLGRRRGRRSTPVRATPTAPLTDEKA